MSRGWRRFRAAMTGAMSLMGLGLVALAWFSIGTVPGEAAVDMGLIGVALPIGFYVVLTLVGWQRSAAPSGLAGVCAKSQLGIVAPFLFGSLLYGLISNASHALERHRARQPTAAGTWSDTFDAAVIRQDCTRAVTQAGDGDARTYCGCIIRGLQNAYTAQELETLPMHPLAAHDARYSRVAEQCRRAEKL